MGFLDHSTNNILVDAVLTTEGRESLADGTFSVESYSFGDDEIDYSNIKKYGTTVGKEKIEKNTPIFEAFTTSVIALKYPLLSVTPETIAGTYFYPVPSFSGNSVTNNVLRMDTVNNTLSGDVIFKVEMTGNNRLPESFDQSEVAIEVDDDLLFIDKLKDFSFSYPDGTRVYDSPTTKLNTGNGTGEKATIVFTLRDAIISSETTFNLYKVSGISGANYIRTFVNFIHRDSGVRKTLEVQIFNS